MDDIRAEHDRGRKRTFKQLTLNFTKFNKNRKLTMSAALPASERQHRVFTSTFDANNSL